MTVMMQVLASASSLPSYNQPPRGWGLWLGEGALGPSMWVFIKVKYVG